MSAHTLRGMLFAIVFLMAINHSYCQDSMNTLQQLVGPTKEYRQLAAEAPSIRLRYTEKSFNKLSAPDTPFEILAGNTMSDRRTNSVLSLHEQLKGNGSLFETCTAINPKYAFELRKNHGTDWFVSNCVATKPDDFTTQRYGFRSPMSRPDGNPQIPGIAISDICRVPITLENISALPNSQIQSIAVSDDTVTVDFHYHRKLYHNDGTRPTVVTVASRMTCLTGHFNLPSRLEQSANVGNERVQLDATRNHTFENELISTFCDTISYRRWAHGNLIKYTVRQIDKRLDYKQIPKRDFRLSSFGFPEPYFPSGGKRMSAWSFWLKLLAFACAVGGWLLHRSSQAE